MESYRRKIIFFIAVIIIFLSCGISRTQTRKLNRNPNVRIQPRRICLYDGNCYEGQMCWWMSCIPKLKNGKECTSDSYCLSDLCVGICIQLRVGQKCLHKKQCLSGRCNNRCLLPVGFSDEYPTINDDNTFTAILDECSRGDVLCKIPWKVVTVTGAALSSQEDRRALGKLMTGVSGRASMRYPGNDTDIQLYNIPDVGAVLGDVVSYTSVVNIEEISVYPNYLNVWLRVPSTANLERRVWISAYYHDLSSQQHTLTQFKKHFRYYGNVGKVRVWWIDGAELPDKDLLHGWYSRNVGSVEVWLMQPQPAP